MKNNIFYKIKNYKFWLITLVIVIVIVLIVCQINFNQKNKNGLKNIDGINQTNFIEQIKAKELFNNDFATVNKIKEISYTEKISSKIYSYQSEVEYKNGVIQRKINILGNIYFLIIDENNNKYFVFKENIDPEEISEEAVSQFEKESLIDKLKMIKKSDYQQIGYQKTANSKTKIYEFINNGVKYKYWIDLETKLPFKIEVFEPENTLTFEYFNIKLK